MKKIIITLTLLFLLTACTPATPAPTPTPTPEPSCAKDYCIQNVSLSLKDNILTMQIALTDVNGEVPIGFDAIPEDSVLAALYLSSEDPDLYLIGFKVAPTGLTCYTGNDVPWTDGTLGRACSLTIAASSLVKQIESGDPIRVEIDIIPSLSPAYDQPAIWLEP